MEGKLLASGCVSGEEIHSHSVCSKREMYPISLLNHCCSVLFVTWTGADLLEIYYCPGVLEKNLSSWETDQGKCLRL